MQIKTGKRKKAARLAAACSLFLLSGCTGLSDSLVRQADRYASGKKEDVYYFQPAAYSMKEILAGYTSEYRRIEWTEEDGEPEQPPKGWESVKAVCSDECISSRQELEETLAKAMEEAALGIELHFDRSKYLPREGEMKQWFEACALTDPLDTLCLKEIRLQQENSGSSRILYLTLYYQEGQEQVLSLRKQAKEAADTFADSLTGTSNMDYAGAVWQYMTEQVVYPETGWEEQPEDFYSRADGALLENKASGQGYAEGAKVLLDRLGLENELLFIEQENGTYRFFNRVKIGEAWYRMDCCFGAAAGGHLDFFQKEEAYADETE